MFDTLIVFAVIYFVGSAVMKRVAAAQKKAGVPPRGAGRPESPTTPPWMRAGTPSRSSASGPTPPAPGPEARPGPKRSAFESLYEAIRDQLDPTAPKDIVPQKPQAPAPAPESMALEQSMGTIQSYETTEGISSESHHNPVQDPASAETAQPVALPGLGIRLNADTLVQGVIFSEILNRKGRGMRR